MKKCTNCLVEKIIGDFYLVKKDQNHPYGKCKVCCRSQAASYQRKKYREYRNEIIVFLGGKCFGCGYKDNLLGIEIDHINNDGYIDRGSRKGPSATDLKRWLKNGCAGLQLLCGTCHAIKTRSKSN